jgi:RND superfamily putative drug exporter
MRNPVDILVPRKLAEEVLRVRKISRMQGITRPVGIPIAHTSTPFLLIMQDAASYA